MTVTELNGNAGRGVCAGVPAFARFKNDNVHIAAFAIRLIGLGVKPSRASSPEETQEWESWQELWRRRFVASILAADTNREVDLRYIGNPQVAGHRVTLAVVGKVRSQDAEAALLAAAELYADLNAIVQINGSTYAFTPITDESELAGVLRPFVVKHLVEFRRAGICCHGSDKPGFRNLPDPSRQSVTVPLGLHSENTNLRFLCQLVAECPIPLMICVKLAHSEVLLPRVDELGVNEEAALAPEISKAVVDRLADLASQKKQLCSITLLVAAAETIPGAVVRMAGCELLGDDARAWEAVDLEPRDLDGSPSALDLASENQPCRDLTRIYTRDEAASVFRLPLPSNENTPGLPRVHTFVPSNLPHEGSILGFKLTTAGRRDIRLAEGDKGKHVYVLGQTGTGKSTLLHSMAMSDIREGRGLCVIDPHGDLLAKILSKVPDDRKDDVVLFDPTDTEHPVGLNLLDARNERDKSFSANELVLILRKLYDPRFTGIIGPQFEQAVRNAALTAMALPYGGTVIDIPKLLADRDYARSRLEYVTDEFVLSFWNDMWLKKSDFHVSEILGYITSKFDPLRSDPMMRRIIGQSRNSLDFRKIMDEGRILLVNLSKGGLGEINSALLGSILVARLFSAALSRHDVATKDRRPFTLYLDEFHNFTTDTVQSMLSEARKYRLALVLAHQNMQQLPQEILQTVLGNVGSSVFFRPGPLDVRTVEDYVRPYLSERDLMDLPNWTAVGRLLIDGMPCRPTVFQVTRDTGEIDYTVSGHIRERARTLFGKPSNQVDEEIRFRSQETTGS